jgi:hypothetical protein
LAKRKETLVAEARGKENKNLAGKKLAAAAVFSLYSPTLRMMSSIAPGSWWALEACPASRFGLEIRPAPNRLHSVLQFDHVLSIKAVIGGFVA